MPLDLVSYLAQHLVNEPDKVKVTAKRDGRQTIIHIRCSEEDAGRIIGRNGRIINSIRTLARATSEGRESIEVKLIDANDPSEVDEDFESDENV